MAESWLSAGRPIAGFDELTEALSIAKVGFWKWRLSDDTFSWSDEIFRILGRDREHFEVNLNSTFDVIHPLDREETRRKLTATVTQKTVQVHEYRAVRPDGETLWLWSNSRPVFDDRGNIIEVRGTCQDITDRKRQEDALRESEVRFRAIADDLPVMIWIADASGRSTFYNRLWTETTGQSEADAVGLGWLSTVHPEDRERVEENFLLASEGRNPCRVEYRLRRADDSWAWVIDAAQPRWSPDGRFLGYVGAILDISDRRDAEIAQRESEEFAFSILQASSDCIEVIDLTTRLLFTNDAGLKLMEIEDFSSISNKPWAELWPPEHAGDVQGAIDAAMAGRLGSFTGYCPTMSGKPKWWDVAVSPIRSPTGEIVRLLGISRDITDVKRSRDEISYLAHHDALTGLANRAMFNKQLFSTFSATGGRDLAVLLLDLDGFKDVNDTFGHPVGDTLLQAVAERLRPIVIDAGLLARVGGDEFAVLQELSCSQLSPSQLAGALMESLEVPFAVGGNLLSLGASIGIAAASDLCQTPDELLKQADIALYRAKYDGRGVSRIYEQGMHEEVAARQALKQDLSFALERGEFGVYYQPLFNLRSGEVSGFEALLRWRHPRIGVVSPAQFIPLAEETGLIVSIGEWVLRQACEQAMNWPSPMIVAVNLSPVQFKNPTLPLTIATILNSSGLSANRLQLEITESVLLHQTEHNLQLLNSIRALGVSVALDDFGTGFSSLSYLRHFHFDRIKIDRSFVDDIGGAGQSEAIIKAVIHLSNALGVSVTAEGVETATQLEWLKQEGCHEVQGYFVGRPVPASETHSLMRESVVRTGTYLARHVGRPR